VAAGAAVFLKVGFGDLGTASVTPSEVRSALGPVTPNVAFRARECPFMADQRSPRTSLRSSGPAATATQEG